VTETPPGGRAAPPQRRWLFWLVIGGLTLAAIYLLRSVLLPFVAGAAVAYFLDPLADWLERHGLSRLMATILITALFVLAGVAALLILLPALQNQISNFIAHLPDYATALESRVKPLIQNLQEVLPDDQVERLRDGASGMLSEISSWALQVIKGLLSSGLALINLLSLLLISPVVAFYLLRDWDRIVETVDGWLPRAHADVIRQRMAEVDTTLAGFVRGQASVCFALGAFYAIGLSVIGLDLGLVVGIGAGLISFIPYVGSIVGFVVSVGLAVAQFSELFPILATAGVFLAGQFLEGNFLSPWLVGGRVGLHPVWIIFALLAGGSLFGFVGILLAVPAAAVIGVLIRHLLAEYLKSGYYAHSDSPEDSPQDSPEGSHGGKAGGHGA